VGETPHALAMLLDAAQVCVCEGCRIGLRKVEVGVGVGAGTPRPEHLHAGRPTPSTRWRAWHWPCCAPAGPGPLLCLRTRAPSHARASKHAQTRRPAPSKQRPVRTARVSLRSGQAGRPRCMCWCTPRGPQQCCAGGGTWRGVKH